MHLQIKEMTNVSIAFDFLPCGEKAPPGWKKTTGHLVWDLKMDFTRKAHWVKDGHRSPHTSSSTLLELFQERVYILLSSLTLC